MCAVIAGTDSAEPGQTRWDLSPEECPELPAETHNIQVQNPAVSIGQITPWSWLILLCLHTQAPQAWAENQKNLTGFTYLGHKKKKAEECCFSPTFSPVAKNISNGFTSPPCYNSHFRWFSLSFLEQLSVSQTRAIVQEWKKTKFNVFILAPSSGHSTVKY